MSCTREVRVLDSANREQFFNTLYKQYEPKLLKFCLRILGNRADAEDVCSETFLRIIQNIDDLRDKRAIADWIYQVAYHCCIDVLRQRREVAILEDLPAKVIGDSELVLSFYQALQEVTDINRAAVLCNLYGLSLLESAEQLKISLGSLRHSLYLGRRQLSELLFDAVTDKGFTD